jgi:hypothetical protein
LIQGDRDGFQLAVEQVGTFIQQCIRDVYRRQRPTPLPSRTAHCCH